MKAENFLKEGHWLQGPHFLKNSESNWPTLPQVPLVLSDSDPEIKKTAVSFSTAVQKCPLTRFIEHFSSWDKLIRSAAWLLKFKKLLKTLSLQRKAGQLQAPVKLDPTESKLFVKDLTEVEESLVSYIQQRSFRDAMTSLGKGAVGSIS